MISIGVVGGTGYTGVELLRILAMHSQVDVKVVTSRSEAGRKISSIYPNLLSNCDLQFSKPDVAELKKCDCVFFAAPNGTAMLMVPELIEAGVKVIDLAADFRIKDAEVWEHWYKQEHVCPDLLSSAVYGLPELHREKIKRAQLVANPGCYPTATILGFVPLLEAGILESAQLIADTKSGVSGAGRAANVPTLFSEAGENFKAYNVNAHRHWPEIKQELEGVSSLDVNFVFTPHLVPMVRGIFATLYVTQFDASLNLTELYQQRYKDEPFVQVLEEGVVPETKHVRASNQCMLSVSKPYDGNTVVVLSGSYLISFGVTAACFLLSLYVAYWVGANGLRIPFMSSHDVKEFANNDEKIKYLEKKVRELEHDLAYVERSTKVELAAVEEMKKTLQEKDLELLELNQELHFYNTLYTANTDNTLVHIKAFNLHKDLVTSRYVYELILTGVPKKNEKQVSGIIGLSVDGEEQEILKRLVFEDASEVSDTSLKFSFKYFQKITGSFTLPEEFEPSSVHLEVRRDKNKKQPIAITYEWDEVFGKS